MDSAEKPVDFDVIIIGAGISGLCFAYKLHERNPHLSYYILEGRNEVGGTWSLFQYPSLRSDSDLFTFGFPWQPWTGKNSIAKGDAIIKFNRKVHGLSWSSHEKCWTVDSIVDSTTRGTLRSSFIVLATGYYDYDEPLQARVPRRSEEDKSKMNDLLFMPLTSTYVEKARSALPKVSDRPQWRPRSSYLLELFTVRFGDIKTGLELIKGN